MADIFHFDVSSGTEQLIREAGDLDLDDIVEESICALTDSAAKAIRSTVPFKTGELRNDHIQIDNLELESTVSIDSEPHESSEFFDQVLQTKNPASDVLANLLDIGDYKRRKDSQTEEDFIGKSKGEKTTGWLTGVGGSFEQFDAKIDRTLEALD